MPTVPPTPTPGPHGPGEGRIGRDELHGLPHGFGPLTLDVGGQGHEDQGAPADRGDQGPDVHGAHRSHQLDGPRLLTGQEVGRGEGVGVVGGRGGARGGDAERVPFPDDGGGGRRAVRLQRHRPDAVGCEPHRRIEPRGRGRGRRGRRGRRDGVRGSRAAPRRPRVAAATSRRHGQQENEEHGRLGSGIRGHAHQPSVGSHGYDVILRWPIFLVVSAGRSVCWR